MSDEIQNTPYARALAMAEQGATTQQIRDALAHEGLDTDSINIVLAGFPAPEVPEPERVGHLELEPDEALDLSTSSDEGRHDMLAGAALFLIGSLVTLATYDAASEHGGTYILAWGPIIFGALRFFRGLAASGD